MVAQLLIQRSPRGTALKLVPEVAVEDQESTMRLLENLERRTGALKVAELAELLGVTPQHIYKMATCSKLSSIRISGAVRFDPQEVGDWLKKRRPGTARAGQSQIPSVAA